jgi:hypothetical protein
MFDPNLMIAPDVGGMVRQGIEQGQQARKQRETENALRALAGNPQDEGAMNALIQADPRMGMEMQQQRQQGLQQQLEAHRENILKGAQIFRQLGVKDEGTYQQARQMAAQMGLDVSQVPPNYDPAYVQGVVSLADAFAPQAEHRPQLVPFTEGGGVARLNQQTGQVEVMVMPNPGGQQAGAPVNASPVLSDDDIMRMEQGGQSPSGSGGFPQF